MCLRTAILREEKVINSQIQNEGNHVLMLTVRAGHILTKIIAQQMQVT